MKRREIKTLARSVAQSAAAQARLLQPAGFSDLAADGTDASHEQRLERVCADVTTCPADCPATVRINCGQVQQAARQRRLQTFREGSA